MKYPERQDILSRLENADIPLVLIGAQALRFYGSSRESLDIDFAMRAIDIDRLLSILYEYGYRLPASVAEDGDKILWAEDAAGASDIIETEKRGALNLYYLDEKGRPVDQIDFVYDNPVPFARLRKNAVNIRENPSVWCASRKDLALMKETRINRGQARQEDYLDLDFLNAAEE